MAEVIMRLVTSSRNRVAYLQTQRDERALEEARRRDAIRETREAHTIVTPSGARLTPNPQSMGLANQPPSGVGEDTGSDPPVQTWNQPTPMGPEEQPAPLVPAQGQVAPKDPGETDSSSPTQAIGGFGIPSHPPQQLVLRPELYIKTSHASLPGGETVRVIIRHVDPGQVAGTVPLGENENEVAQLADTLASSTERVRVTFPADASSKVKNLAMGVVGSCSGSGDHFPAGYAEAGTVNDIFNDGPQVAEAISQAVEASLTSDSGEASVRLPVGVCPEHFTRRVHVETNPQAPQKRRPKRLTSLTLNPQAPCERGDGMTNVSDAPTPSLVASMACVLEADLATRDAMLFIRAVTDQVVSPSPNIERIEVQPPDLINLQPPEGSMRSRQHHLRPVPRHEAHQSLITVDQESGLCETMDDFIELAGNSRPIDLGWQYEREPSSEAGESSRGGGRMLPSGGSDATLNHGQSLIDEMRVFPIILSARNIKELWPAVYADLLWQLVHQRCQCLLVAWKGQGGEEDLERNWSGGSRYRAPDTPQE